MLDEFLDLEIFARTLYGEARGEVKYFGERSLEAIAHVILNRGTKIREVCLKPYQFSCWNKNDPNYRMLMQKVIQDEVFNQCLTIASNFMNFRPEDFTLGANHYHTKNILPYWAKGMVPTIEVGRHLFYQL